MPTQIALDKADPAVNEIISMLSEGEPISLKVTGVPGPTGDPVVMIDVTDIEMEEEMEDGEAETQTKEALMPETQLRDGGFDTGPTSQTKRKANSKGYR